MRSFPSHTDYQASFFCHSLNRLVLARQYQLRHQRNSRLVCEANPSERMPPQQERGARVSVARQRLGMRRSARLLCEKMPNQHDRRVASFFAGRNVPGTLPRRLLRLSLFAAECVACVCVVRLVQAWMKQERLESSGFVQLTASLRVLTVILTSHNSLQKFVLVNLHISSLETILGFTNAVANLYMHNQPRIAQNHQ